MFGDFDINRPPFLFFKDDRDVFGRPDFIFQQGGKVWYAEHDQDGTPIWHMGLITEVEDGWLEIQPIGSIMKLSLRSTSPRVWRRKESLSALYLRYD